MRWITINHTPSFWPWQPWFWLCLIKAMLSCEFWLGPASWMTGVGSLLWFSFEIIFFLIVLWYQPCNVERVNPKILSVTSRICVHCSLYKRIDHPWLDTYKMFRNIRKLTKHHTLTARKKALKPATIFSIFPFPGRPSKPSCNRQVRGQGWKARYSCAMIDFSQWRWVEFYTGSYNISVIYDYTWCYIYNMTTI